MCVRVRTGESERERGGGVFATAQRSNSINQALSWRAKPILADSLALRRPIG